MRFVCFSLAGAMLIGLTATGPSLAIPQFYKEFEKEYLDNHPDQKYAEALKKTADRCFICHQGRKSKKNHNAFGKPLAELLDRKKDMKDTKKIQDALKKVLAMHVNPEDEKSETFMDRVKASKWPGGELEDLKKEPQEEATAGN